MRTAGKATDTALILYWSATGNTEKVVRAIERGLLDEGVKPSVVNVTEADRTDLYDYDLVFLGCPSISFLPPEPVLRFVKRKMNFHRDQGDIKVLAPRVPGKQAVVFVTYSGPHTGIAEAIPVGKYLGQFLAHLGFAVLDEWYVVGEFHGNEEYSTRGCLGDIRGRPNDDDLARVARQAAQVARERAFDDTTRTSAS
jgi:hypothetical protein